MYLFVSWCVACDVMNGIFYVRFHLFRIDLKQFKQNNCKQKVKSKQIYKYTDLADRLIERDRDREVRENIYI